MMWWPCWSTALGFGGAIKKMYRLRPWAQGQPWSAAAKPPCKLEKLLEETTQFSVQGRSSQDNTGKNLSSTWIFFVFPDCTPGSESDLAASAGSGRDRLWLWPSLSKGPAGPVWLYDAFMGITLFRISFIHVKLQQVADPTSTHSQALLDHYHNLDDQVRRGV